MSCRRRVPPHPRVPARPLHVHRDLVTAERWRSKAYGRALNDHLLEAARAAGCSKVQLDSGTQRTDAHRFYFRERYSITSFHFSRDV
ncbi:MAG: GNAT family N-acetyltransferase [Actinomycetota bacterium]|nr:GNAT family N-acetyltransferase [Actinomycetota bacterium]